MVTVTDAARAIALCFRPVLLPAGPLPHGVDSRPSCGSFSVFRDRCASKAASVSSTIRGQRMEENLLRSCSPTDGDPPSNGTNTHARPSPDVVLRSGDHSVDQILVELLQDRGWFAFATPSLDDAMSACQATTDFALCVVDERGLEYMVKASRPTISGQTVIMALLTRPTPISAVSALRHGAHVLLPLPVDTALFIAQVEALLRRFQRASLHFFGGFGSVLHR